MPLSPRDLEPHETLRTVRRVEGGVLVIHRSSMRAVATKRKAVVAASPVGDFEPRARDSKVVLPVVPPIGHGPLALHSDCSVRGLFVTSGQCPLPARQLM